MTTLKQQRQAIAAGMATSRAPTGQAQRQAGGQAMETNRRAIADANYLQRTGQQVANDINRLTDPRAPRKTLRPVEPVGALPATRGRGVYKPPPATGGIASPLVEQSGTREFHPPRTVTSTDGLLVMQIRQVKTLHMLDANDAEVVMEFPYVPWP